MGWVSAAAATHVVVMEQIISILVLIVLNHGHGAHQLAHGHFLWTQAQVGESACLPIVLSQNLPTWTRPRLCSLTAPTSDAGAQECAYRHMQEGHHRELSVL